MFKNKLKKALKNGETKFGTFTMLNSPEVVELIALSGFDFVIIDTEHGPGSIESSIGLIRAAESKGITPIVRITEPSTTTILRNLDIGAHGILVPQVNDKKVAEHIVSSTKYFPLGTRGVTLARAADYGTGNDPLEYFKSSNNETMIIVQCESKEGLDNLAEIAKTPEVDVIFFGPFDMSQSLGIPGQLSSEPIEEAAEKILKICKENGKAAGVFAMNGEQAKIRVEQGFQFIALGIESIFFCNALKKELTVARK
ncbi:HpcH/HpaI aldolase family protein [Clostridium sp. DL1XJH146]